jgi:hypothetical protein
MALATLSQYGLPITPVYILPSGIVLALVLWYSFNLPMWLIDKYEDRFRVYLRKEPHLRRWLGAGSISLIFAVLIGGGSVFGVVYGWIIFWTALVVAVNIIITFLTIFSLFPKVFIVLEGSNDVNFLKSIARVLRENREDVPDLEQLEKDGDVIFVPMGGGNLDSWTSRFEVINRSELYIVDRDTAPPEPAKHQAFADKINKRRHCQAFITDKREMENYLHPAAIKAVRPEVDIAFGDFDDVPLLVARAVHCASNSSKPWDELGREKKDEKIKGAKRWLNEEATGQMTPTMLDERDPTGEVRGWLNWISRELKD